MYNAGLLGAWRWSRGKTEKKKYFLFLFSESNRFLSDGLFCKYTRTYMYFVFVLSATLREGTYLHCQECSSRLSKRLSSKGISLEARTHFQWWQLVQEQFHSCVCYARLVLSCVKANYSLSSNWYLSRKRIPRCCCYCCGIALPFVSYCCVLLIFNKRLGVHTLDRHYCGVVSFMVWSFSCHSPTPSVVPTSFKSSRLQVEDLKFLQLLTSSELPDFRSGGERQDSSWLMEITKRRTRFLVSITRTNRCRTTLVSKPTSRPL
jgi:hypothetical protein